jgi:amidophosphoribosyltransferase
MCGIFGTIGHKDAARLTYLGLYALQHRGEESAGIISYDSKKLRSYTGMGAVRDLFTEKIIRSLRGKIALGHVRYSTTGSSIETNIQPFLVKHKRGHLAIAHNGNLVNTLDLREVLEERGSIFQTTMDSEIIIHLIVQSSDSDMKDKVISALAKLEGAYSLILMIDNTLIGARDPHGFRPLCLGKIDGSYVLSSETSAFDLIQAEYIRDVEPGEIVFIKNNKIESIKPFSEIKSSICIFEYIYFARPDSNIFGKNVYVTRKRLGEQLAKEHPVKCDLIMSIPDSGSYAAVGFAKESKRPLEVGMIRNHYVGRTFIQPTQFIRDFKVKVKLNPIKEVLKGKRIAVVEDSIVRGTTSKARIETLREAGAKEIHMRVSCPPLRYPCFYGIDFPTKRELIASKLSISGIRDFMGLDSLRYLSIKGMLNAMLLPKNSFCTACFDGKYPTKTPKRVSKFLLEKRGS